MTHVEEKFGGHVGNCPGYALLTSQGEATEFRERIGMTILTREAMRETCKDRVAERKRVRENRRARKKRGAGDVPEELGDKYDEQVAVRHADASGGHIIENQHETRRKRDIKVSGAVKASSRPCSTRYVSREKPERMISGVEPFGGLLKPGDRRKSTKEDQKHQKNKQTKVGKWYDLSKKL